MKIVIPADRPKYERELPGGVDLTLSPILKTDREFFERGIEELSLESRFARFGQGVSSLSAQELDYLSDVDQRSHVAWGALVGDEAAGVGRYIMMDDPTKAEIALTVLDSMQRRGVGRALFEALIAVGRHDGIHEFAFEARSDNEAVISLMAEIEVTPLMTDGVIERTIRISDLPTTTHDRALVEVIEEVRSQKESAS
ncbi:MAG TPA: GNAT family N-acetyltransferase [Acidimicrobiia bacterium]|nr:GNAT family N-acetyltransferase [Acidimicrobiia bacterium]